MYQVDVGRLTSFWVKSLKYFSWAIFSFLSPFSWSIIAASLAISGHWSKAIDDFQLDCFTLVSSLTFPAASLLSHSATPPSPPFPRGRTGNHSWSLSRDTPNRDRRKRCMLGKREMRLCVFLSRWAAGSMGSASTLKSGQAWWIRRPIPSLGLLGPREP
jgi:hypothetical protein